jgi:diadenosine tetraphosphate (Ap4A) HIT family hydrolase
VKESHPCPLCVPRPDDCEHWLKVATLATSTLYLDRNQTYQGHCQLVYDGPHVEGLEQLESQAYTRFTEDLRTAALAIFAAQRPDRLNYVSLGNVVPHVHWHIVPRYRSDPRWGAPIYTTDMRDMKVTYLDEAGYRRTIGAIRKELGLSQKMEVR